MALHTFGAGALLTAVYTRLTTGWAAAVPGVTAYSVYNFVPTTATLPYVMIGGLLGGRSDDFLSRDIKGEDLVIHAHVWSSAQGDSQAATMMSNIVTALTTTDLAITGYTTLKGIYDYGQIMIDDTNAAQILRHGILRFRFQIA
jgi:hypothetical protein